MRKLVLVVIALLALFALFRAYSNDIALAKMGIRLQPGLTEMGESQPFVCSRGEIRQPETVPQHFAVAADL